jgi:hypothetical protein
VRDKGQLLLPATKGSQPLRGQVLTLDTLQAEQMGHRKCQVSRPDPYNKDYKTGVILQFENSCRDCYNDKSHNIRDHSNRGR